jgi:tetratricopeptide (TPR) repeat protein
MFERPTAQQIARSDALACEYFNQGQWERALKQNQCTRDLVGRETPEFLKNASACYSQLLHPKRAIYYFERYLKSVSQPSSSDFKQLADYYAQSGDLASAEKLLYKCNNPDFDNIHDRVIHLFRHEQYQEAFETLDREKRKHNVLWIGHARWNMLPRCMRWNGEDITNKKICLVGESGLGDEIVFARWIPELMKLAKKVDYLTKNSLIDVFRRNWPELGIYNPVENYDFWIPGMCLPLVLKQYIPNPTPYIKPDPETISKWQDILPNSRNRIGLCWTGSKTFSQNRFRDIPIDYLSGKFSNACLINICMETDENPPNLFDARPHITCWEDTFAILSLCARVFSSCTSVAHAAGAIGQPTYVYTRPDDYFTWNASASGTPSKWHKTVTVWRTETIGQWKTVIDQSFKKLPR